MQNPFIWTANGQKMTPGQVERLRDRSEVALLRGMDTSPIGHWSQGLARVVDAYGGGRGMARADALEAAGIKSAQEAMHPVVQALMPPSQQVAAPMAGVPATNAQAAIPRPGLFGLGALFGRR